MAESQQTVVMAVDASEHSDYAFQWYVDNFHRPGNKVVLVHCPEYYLGTTDASIGRMEAELQEVKAKTEVLKGKFVKKLSDCGITGEFVVLSDLKPAHAIVDFAKQRNASMIVTGTRGLGKVRRTILGSVSSYITHHSHVPVLICKQK